MPKQLIVSIALVGALALSWGCNRNYGDITRASSQVDASVDVRMKAFEASTSLSERHSIKWRVVDMRKKQLTMAERVEVSSMPGVEKGEVTRADAEAQKAAMIATAKEKLAAAEKLSVDPPAAPGAVPAAPSGNPAPAAPK